MSLAACVSIPSSLDVDRLTMTAPDNQEVRLHEARRERARCPACGKLGVLEVLTVHRSGLPSVRRTVIRCTRTGRKDPRGRELASTRCPLAIVSEEPLPAVEARRFSEFSEDHEKGAGPESREFREFREHHEKGVGPEPAPAPDVRRSPQESAPGDFHGLPPAPVEAARDTQEAEEEPTPPAVSPDPEPAPLGRPGGQDEPEAEEVATMPEEPTRKGRTCQRCPNPIDGTGGRRYCAACALDAKNEGRRARYLKVMDRRRKGLPPIDGRRWQAPTDGTPETAPAPEANPRPLEVLRQLLDLDPEARAAVLVLARTEAA